MTLGCVVGCFLLPTKKIVRPDGSRVILMKHPSWKSEFLALWELIRTDYYIVLMFPVSVTPRLLIHLC
jgi:hypothetical protein